MLSVIIPAHNEANYIGACLASVVAQELDPANVDGVEVLVVANGCSDDTADLAQAKTPEFVSRGFGLRVMEKPTAGKYLALNCGDAAASGEIRIYLDADVVLSRTVFRQIASALAAPAPRIATGTLSLVPPKSLATRMFARVWTQLPFFSEAAPCPGLYAVNAAGRARWEAFPDIISDDSFVRALFAPEERVQIAAEYHWPLAEGAGRLVRVRRRQELGIRELGFRFPGLKIGPAERHNARQFAKIAARDPAAFFVYALLTGLAKITVNRGDRRWHGSR